MNFSCQRQGKRASFFKLSVVPEESASPRRWRVARAIRRPRGGHTRSGGRIGRLDSWSGRRRRRTRASYAIGLGTTRTGGREQQQAENDNRAHPGTLRQFPTGCLPPRWARLDQAPVRCGTLSIRVREPLPARRYRPPSRRPPTGRIFRTGSLPASVCRIPYRLGPVSPSQRRFWVVLAGHNDPA